MIAKKVLLVGNFGVGKTSLIRRFVFNEFSEDYISTIGVRVSTKTVALENEEVKLLIWDVAGTSEDEKIPKSYFLGAHAAMYVFDLSRIETYEKLEAYVDSVRELSGLKNILIVGNKKDLLTENQLKECLASISIPIDLVTSAKENANVEDAFISLAKQTLK